MRRASLTIASLGLFLTPAPSGAFESSDADSYQSTLANCVVRLKAQQARNFVVGSAEPPRDERCLGAEWSQATFRIQTYRYALARALLQRDYASGLPSEIAQLAAIPIVQTGSDRSSSSIERQRMTVADCVIRKDPAKAFALVGTEAGEEGATPLMSQLSPSIVDCPEGKTMRYPTGFEMQEAIVTRMYQLAYAAKRPRDA